MNDLYFSVPTLVFCCLGYYYSWRHYTAGNFNISLFLVLLCGFSLRIYVASDFFLHDWDERFHALVAKNLMHHPLLPTLYENPILPFNYSNWTSNHIWLHKQPLPLWIMAFSMHVFGVNELALRLPSILLSTVGIGLSYYIGTYFFSKKVGYWTAFLFSINGLIIELTGGRVATDHVDIFFLFFTEFAIACSILFVKTQRTSINILVGILIGAAILSKWIHALIVLPIWLLIVLDSKKFKPRQIWYHLLILLAACAIIFLPWQIYIHKTYPLEANWEASFNFKHLTEVIEGHDHPFYYFIDRIRINYGELVYIPLLWFLWKSVNNRQDLKRLAISIWVLIPLLFFSFAKTKMQGYILFISPALFLMTSEFLVTLNEYKNQSKHTWLFNALSFLLLALPIRYMFERVKPFAQSDRNPSWVSNLRELNKRQVGKGVLFNYDKPIEAMFYTNLTVYSDIPSGDVLSDLLKKGYTIIINDDGNLPEYMQTIKGVTIEKIAVN